MWRRKSLAGVVGTGGDVKKSIFNKKKWLPLARDTDFKISDYCCHVMKKQPLSKYHSQTKRVPYIGTQASESQVRTQAWVRHGCNAFEGNKQTSQPLSFWNEQDVLQYILLNGLEIASVYGDIITFDDEGNEYPAYYGCSPLKCSQCQRTGCVYCGFGFHLEKGETRFQRLAKTHPKQYEYCIGGVSTSTIPIMTLMPPNMMANGRIGIPEKYGSRQRKVLA